MLTTEGPSTSSAACNAAGRSSIVVDVHGRQAGEHRRQARPQPAWAEPVVAVEVVVEQLLAGHTHGVRVVVEQQERHRQAVLHRGVHLHAVHEERAVAGDDHGPSSPPERDTDAGAEAVSHAAHAQRDDESPVAAGRQVVDRRRRRCCRRRRRRRHRRAARRPARPSRRGTACRGRRAAGVAARSAGTRSGTRTPVGRPSPFSAASAVVSDPRRSSVWMWVHGTNGAADPIERSAPRPAHRPARRARSPSAGCRPAGTARCRRSPSATPGCPITPVTPSADDDPSPGVPATSLASGTVATRARSIERSCASSARASSRATCSPAMIVIGPSAFRSARAIGLRVARAATPTVAVGSVAPAPCSPDVACWTSFGSSSTAGPPRAGGRDRLGQRRGDVIGRRAPDGRTPTPRRTAPRASSAPLRPLVSWKAPRPSRVVGGWPISASTGTRLANDSPSPATGFRHPPPDVAATTPSPAPLRLYRRPWSPRRTHAWPAPR